MEIQINKNINEIQFDLIIIDNSGLVRIKGWSKIYFEKEKIKLFINSKKIKQEFFFNNFRPDVSKNNKFFGFCIDYFIQENIKNIKIVFENSEIFSRKIDFNISKPHYHNLFNDEEILHRNNIYGSGMPNNSVSPIIWELVKDSEGPVLDFGCGIGILVNKFNQNKKEAVGLEFNSLQIKNNIPEENKDFVKLYDGTLPLPFNDNSFETVTAIEVIEHISNYEEIIKEISRITKNYFIMTVPNISAIPLLHKEGVIPWHLLEKTHLNFFNQASLTKLLKKYFKIKKVIRIGEKKINKTFYYNNLAVICQKRF